MSTVSTLPRDLVFDASILAADGSRLMEDVVITARRSKRGDGDGQVWRGLFVLPADFNRRPTFGDSFYVQVGRQPRISAVIIEVAGRIIHFRARGRLPEFSSSHPTVSSPGSVSARAGGRAAG